jgi:bisphosphoglycerate-dependent phosphoglycerate mutase
MRDMFISLIVLEKQLIQERLTEDGGKKFLRNVDIRPPHFTAQQQQQQHTNLRRASVSTRGASPVKAKKNFHSIVVNSRYKRSE